MVLNLHKRGIRVFLAGPCACDTQLPMAFNEVDMGVLNTSRDVPPLGSAVMAVSAAFIDFGECLIP